MEMTTGMLVWMIVLAFLGLNAALIAWFIVRFTAGPFWALFVFNAVLFGTVYHIIQLSGLT
jgi:hypothetical protein